MNTMPGDRPDATLKSRWNAMLEDRATFCLEHYVTWLDLGGAAAEDFRELTELLIKAAQDKSTVRERYKASLHWKRKTDPVIRRITTKYPTFPGFALGLKPGDAPFFSAEPIRKDLRGTWDLTACHAFGELQEILAAGLLLNIGRCKLACKVHHAVICAL